MSYGSAPVYLSCTSKHKLFMILREMSQLYSPPLSPSSSLLSLQSSSVCSLSLSLCRCLWHIAEAIIYERYESRNEMWSTNSPTQVSAREGERETSEYRKVTLLCLRDHCWMMHHPSRVSWCTEREYFRSALDATCA